MKLKTGKQYRNIGENRDDHGYGDDYLNTTPKTQYMKDRMNKLNSIKIKNFCSLKDNVKRMRRQATY